MVTVMGATGHTGKEITQTLLKAGEKVRALGRSKARLAELERLGAEVAGLHAQEERLKKLDRVHLLILRPVSFFENFSDYFGLIKDQGIAGDSVLPDLALPMVATKDVANVAARALQARGWTGVAVRELLGPRDLSYSEATRLLGECIGKPDLQYIQLDYDEMADSLVQAGLSESFARLYVDMTRAFNDGRVRPRDGRTPENTTPTRFEDVAEELAVAYEAA